MIELPYYLTHVPTQVHVKDSSVDSYTGIDIEGFLNWIAKERIKLNASERMIRTNGDIGKTQTSLTPTGKYF